MEVVAFIRSECGTGHFVILRDAPVGGLWWVRTPGGELLGPRDTREGAVALAA